MPMPPSRVRWRIAALLLAITSLTYLDRLNIAVAAAYIRDEFGLTNVQLGTILSAFVLGYALFQIPGGVLADKVGPKRLLGWAILWWSLFTGLTALAGDLPPARWLGLAWSFILFRFLVGVGEAPALPSANRLVGLWMAPRERGLGNGIFIAGLGLGSAAAPPLIVWIMEHWGWRASFWVTGLLGLPLLLLWAYYGAGRPEDHPRVNAAELSWIRGDAQAAPSAVECAPIPWRSILSDSSIWSLVVSYALAGYTTYIFFTWSFLYIVNVRKLPLANARLWAMAPFLAMTLFAPVGGYVSDLAVCRWGKRWGRRVPVIFGTTLAAALLVAGSRADCARLAVALLALAAGALSLAIPNWWATTVDISPQFAGSLAGLMNTLGNLGGVISPTLTPYLAGRFGWVVALEFAAGVALLSGLLWLFVYPDRPLKSESHAMAGSV